MTDDHTGYPMTGDQDEEEFRRDARVILAARAMDPAWGVAARPLPPPPPIPEQWATAETKTRRRSYRLNRIWVARTWRRLIKRGRLTGRGPDGR